MISVNIRTNNVRRTLNLDVNETPRAAFAEIGMNVNFRNQVSLSGVLLSEEELDQTFADLEVEDGDDVTLSSIVKGDGAVD